MTHRLTAALTLGLAVLAAPAPAQQTDAQAVIARQIEAFRADDVARAFSFASPTIQSMFGTPQNFGAMVRQGYPMVWRAGDLRFLDAETRDGSLWQDVMIRDAQGRVHILEYEMTEGPDGWRINGVRLRNASQGMA